VAKIDPGAAGGSGKTQYQYPTKQGIEEDKQDLENKEEGK
jgi:hypothetical protein